MQSVLEKVAEILDKINFNTSRDIDPVLVAEIVRLLSGDKDKKRERKALANIKYIEYICVRLGNIRGRSTVVVRLLAKEKVVGSNPIARSSFCRWLADMVQGEPLCASQNIYNWRRRQVARQGSAKPSSWVQIPSSPQTKKTGNVPVFFCYLNEISI